MYKNIFKLKFEPLGGKYVAQSWNEKTMWLHAEYVNLEDIGRYV